MTVIIKSALLLTLSNLFMTFAWYAHLKNLSGKPWYLAALASWGDSSPRIPDPGPGQPHRVHGHEPRATQNTPGTDHPFGLCPFFHPLYGTTSTAQFSLGRPVPAGGGLFHF